MKKVLITGAGSGIGCASALALARRSHTVIATAMQLSDLDNLKKEAEQKKLKLQYEKIDVRREKDLQKIGFYEPDVLINNAAIGESGPVSEIPMDRVRDSFDTNILGIVRGVQLAAEHMLRNKRGRILILGSVSGSLVVPFNGAYHMTKYALEALADGLRQELEPRGIYVSLIKPGKIDTGFNQRMGKTKYEWLKKTSAFYKLIPSLKRSDKKMWEGGYTTRPVVKSIIQAIESKKPKSRYITPPIYHLAMLLIKIFPDRIIDKALYRMMKLNKPLDRQ